MYNTFTNTYTKIDIRKTFEGFEADLLMIARRTGKWSIEYTNNVFHDIIQLAENGYLSVVDIILTDAKDHPLRATKYTVNSNGTAMTSDRASGNDWVNLPNTTLNVMLSYSQKWKDLSAEDKSKFRRDAEFLANWGPSNIDNSFPHLTKTDAQLFGSNGYELQKQNYK